MYLSYKHYLTRKDTKIFEILTDNSHFHQEFSHGIFLDDKVPECLIETLILPIVHEISEWNPPTQKETNDFFEFYGLFLRFYNPSLAKKSGIVHTPKTVVDFMFDGIDYLVEHKFSIKKGLRNSDFPFQIIDPASGTMNFFSQLLGYVPNPEFRQKIVSHNLFAIELNSLSFNLGLAEINSIIPLKSFNHNFLLQNTLTQESYVKMVDFLTTPHPSISILVGNPPYYINTQNTLPWIHSQLAEFKINLNEKNLKILSDDYVKFFRISQKLFQEKNRTGIIAYITNNNYLDGPVFKSMRKNLIDTFNEIYIVNLHGNYRKNESGNIFNIKVGVAIIFLVKTLPDYLPDPNNTLSYTEYGEKNQIFYLDINFPNVIKKMDFLSKGFDVSQFQKVELTNDYFLIPRENDLEQHFQEFLSIKSLFLTEPKSGIMTGRDSLVSNPDLEVLKENLTLFFNKKFQELQDVNVNVKKTKTWDPQTALQRSSRNNAIDSITQYNYRGFIKDYLAYDKFLIDGCRFGYLDAISSNNPAICVTRSIRADHFSHTLMVDSPPEKCLLGIKDSSYVFLLRQPKDTRKFNLDITKIPCDTTPELLFNYIYGVLNAPTYRIRYVEQLKRHFPRIPFPNEKSIFNKMAIIGWKLAEIHLGRVDLRVGEFEIQHKNNPTVEDFFFDEETNCIFFSSKRGALEIKSISQEMWNYDIGGIKQLEYWLKSRRCFPPTVIHKKRHIGLSRPLTDGDLGDFLEICAKIRDTIELLPKIDDIYKEIDFL